jgi:hypothetical protein
LLPIWQIHSRSRHKVAHRYGAKQEKAQQAGKKAIDFLTHISSVFSFVTIHGTAPCIRKSSQQAVCRFYEALSFAHVWGGSCFTGSLQQEIFAYVQAQRSNLLM